MVERGVGLVKKKRRIAFSVFFFNDTATTEIYTLSLHDALPISMFRHHFQPIIRPSPEKLSCDKIQQREAGLRMERPSS